MLQSDFNQKQSDKEQEVISLKEKLEASTQLTKTETQKEYQEQLNQKDLEISKLNAKLEQILSQNKIHESKRLNKNIDCSYRQRKMKFKP